MPVGDIPSFKLVETEFSCVVPTSILGCSPYPSWVRYSFLDIGPLSKGHALVIPKCAYRFVLICSLHLIAISDHAEKMHQLPDEYLSDAMPVAKKIATALGAENYNILQV